MSEFISNHKPTVSPQTLMDKFSSLKKEAYSHLDQALSFDSSAQASNPSKIDTLIIMYEKCLNLIDQATGYYENNEILLSTFSQEATQMYNQLKSVKIQTSDRINTLKTSRVSTLNSNTEFLDLGDQILNSDDDCVIIEDLDDTAAVAIPRDFTKANEILSLENRVQLFYIANDGSVSTPSYPTSLSVYSFEDSDSKNEKKILAFIRVDNWMYPLVQNESPGMKTTFNAYIFPNNNNNEQENVQFSFVGISFSNQVSQDEKQFFEDVLVNYGSLIYQDNTQQEGVKRPLITPTPSIKSNDKIESDQTNKDISKSWSAENIAQKLISGANYISQGVSTTTEYASKYIKVGGEKAKSSLTPSEEPVNVNPKIKSTFQNVRYGTHVTVRVSSYLLNKLGSIAHSTAKTVAPHLKNGSTALLAKTGLAGNKDNANNYVENVCTVAHGSIKGFSMVYDSLEQAAKTLAKNVAEQTVTVVEHK